MKIFIMLSAVAMLSGMRAFMSDTCETVWVDMGNGPVRLNKSDYDAPGGAKKYGKIVDAPVPPVPAPAVANTLTTPAPAIPPVPAPVIQAPATGDPGSAPKFLVMEDAGKFFVVNLAGERITDNPVFKPEGYSTQTDAQDAITASQVPIAP